MTPPSAFDPAALGRRLAATHKGSTAVPHAEATPPDRDTAFRVQDATLASLGPIGGWKVGAKGLDQEPNCAPLPAAGFFSSGITLAGPPWRMRGIELEVAVRLAHDLVPRDGPPDAATVRAAIGEVLPAIEVVETRLADWRDSTPLAQLADLQSHGGMVLGAPSTLVPDDVDLRVVEAYLAFDGQPVAVTRGANPAADIWRLLSWLAWHCVQRGAPLRAGQVVTTGSCTGMLFAPEGAHVQAQLAGIGLVELRF
ncbi:2-keto-4-pentenoate hydratase [Caenimonas aquaedulcis]|uniref:Fumarylacetoacetate hydrolase family protein n=1 Tax=Caenimonas aquaedulcis TaxID=2793270 RepID=A0A931H866_9BURK|nr:fumarylacetoacetate hydrolase family protein [Caenimonas aquaedulcis]MBG9390313.1 fumarylacetoacetate hydrolase family protein [Caenimonas aquaedulcis]